MAALTPAVQFADADVFHARLRPSGPRFRYRVLAIHVDLDQLEEHTATRLFTVGPLRLLGFRSADHGRRDGSSLRSYVDALHQSAGLERPNSVSLTCFPRMLGIVFNPLSIYCCHDANGSVMSVAYEVRNTFGETHTYFVAVDENDEAGVSPHECDKIFYVSPFMDMALRYRFLLAPLKHGEFSLKIIERDREGVVLTALMQTRTFAPTRAALLARIIATPLMGFKVLFAIHLQALRLWLMGHAIRPRPTPPVPVSMGATGAYSVPSTTLTGQ